MTLAASNMAMAGSILASPAFCFVARIAVAVGSILMFATHTVHHSAGRMNHRAAHQAPLAAL